MKHGLPTNFVEIFVNFGCAIQQIEYEYGIKGAYDYKLVDKDNISSHCIDLNNGCFCDYMSDLETCYGTYYIPIIDTDFYVAVKFRN